MYEYSEIREVHLEVSDVCNAACPMCARIKANGKRMNRYLTNATIDLDQFKQIFFPNFVKQLHRINFCGVLGDPITAKDLPKQIKYLLDINPQLDLEISTNGGIRSTNWWKELGTYMNIPERKVSFGIDGLEDTNHLYRRNVQWNKLMENVEAFISAGGYAHWQIIKFKHNEHQLEEIKNLAIKMGFSKIVIKDTNRFQDKKFEVFDIGGTIPTHCLEPPSDFVPKIVTKKNLSKAEIKCHVKKLKEIYISAKGEVLPCCYLYSDITENPEIYKNIGTIDDFKITKNNTIKDIIDSKRFHKIENTWKLKSLQEGKIKKCAEICGIMNQVKIDKTEIKEWK